MRIFIGRRGLGASAGNFGPQVRRQAWLSGHRRRAGRISRAFIKSGYRGYTVKGVRGFMSRKPWVW